MIKKARVTEIYQINMFCDLCGKIMERENTMLCSNPPQFVYKCECGHTECSREIYPKQQVFFDAGNAEEWGAGHE